MSVFDPNGPIFCHFSNAAAASGCCSRNRVNSSDSSPGLGKYRSLASRLSISRSTRYLPSRVPRSPFRRWVFHPGSVNDGAISLRRKTAHTRRARGHTCGGRVLSLRVSILALTVKSRTWTSAYRTVRSYVKCPSITSGPSHAS